MSCCGDASSGDTATVNGKKLAPPDSDFNGLARKRSPTNVFFLILFVAFCIGGFVYVGMSYARGDLMRVLHGYDPYGNVCGKDNPEYFNNSLSGQDMTGLRFLDVNGLTTIGGFTPSIKGLCVAECGPNVTQLAYYCIPNLIDNTSLSTAADMLGSPFQKISVNISKGRYQLLYMCLVGIAISMAFTLMLRYIAPFMVWATVLIISLGSIAATIAMWMLWKKEDDYAKELAATTGMETVAEDNAGYAKILLYIAIAVTIATVILLVILIALRSRIRLVIALFREAGKVLASIPMLIFIPILTTILTVSMLVIWFAGLLMILSASHPTTDGTFITFKLDKIIAYMRWYHIFGLLWGTQFILGCQYITIAGAVSDWYFQRDKDKLSYPIFNSISRLAKCHLGSVAFGSLILAIVSLIRILMKKLESRLQKMTGSSSKCLCCCCQSCLWIFDKFIKFLTKNAYIEIAIFGNGFCKSAQMAFMIIASNALKVAALTFIGDFLLFLVRLAIVGMTVFIGMLIVQTNPAISNMLPVLVLGGIFTFLIATCFITVYDITIDTLFLCFCEDHQRNNGLDKPYFMSRGLMKFVENSKAALDALDNKGTTSPFQFQVVPIPIQFIQPNGQPIAFSQTEMKSGLTPLHAAYKPISLPPSPAQYLTPKR